MDFIETIAGKVSTEVPNMKIWYNYTSYFIYKCNRGVKEKGLDFFLQEGGVEVWVVIVVFSLVGERKGGQF